jgi:hypothetical protein
MLIVRLSLSLPYRSLILYTERSRDHNLLHWSAELQTSCRDKLTTTTTVYYYYYYCSVTTTTTVQPLRRRRLRDMCIMPFAHTRQFYVQYYSIPCPSESANNIFLSSPTAVVHHYHSCASSVDTAAAAVAVDDKIVTISVGLLRRRRRRLGCRESFLIATRRQEI